MQTATTDGMLLYVGQPVKCSVAHRLDRSMEAGSNSLHLLQLKASLYFTFRDGYHCQVLSILSTIISLN